MSSKWTAGIGILTLVAVVGLAGPAAAEVEGQKVFEAQKCNMCHAVPSAGIEAKTTSEKMKGPDLVDLKRDAKWIAGYLQKTEQIDGADHKKEFKGSDEELQALVDWLLEQKAE